MHEHRAVNHHKSTRSGLSRERNVMFFTHCDRALFFPRMIQYCEKGRSAGANMKVWRPCKISLFLSLFLTSLSLCHLNFSCLSLSISLLLLSAIWTSHVCLSPSHSLSMSTDFIHSTFISSVSPCWMFELLTITSSLICLLLSHFRSPHCWTFISLSIWGRHSVLRQLSKGKRPAIGGRQRAAWPSPHSLQF